MIEKRTREREREKEIHPHRNLIRDILSCIAFKSTNRIRAESPLASSLFDILAIILAIILATVARVCAPSHAVVLFSSCPLPSVFPATSSSSLFLPPFFSIALSLSLCSYCSPSLRWFFSLRSCSSRTFLPPPPSLPARRLRTGQQPGLTAARKIGRNAFFH